MKYLILLLSLTILISSCKKDKDDPQVITGYKGVFVLNEGAFNQNNASVTFRSNDKQLFYADLFTSANGTTSVLGDVAQSMTIYNNQAFIVLNGSGKIKAVSINDFKITGTISGFTYPRYMSIYNNLAYITDQGTNKLYKADPSTYTIKDSLTCGEGPEEMLINGNDLIVCNAGYLTDDSTISIINTATFTQTNKITLSTDPVALVKDANGNIWVLCKGSLGSDYMPSADDIAGALYKLNAADYSVVKKFNFPSNTDHPYDLKISQDGQTLYYLNGSSYNTGSVFKMNISDMTLPTMPFINRLFYSLGINTNDNTFYCGNFNFTTNAYVVHYDTNGTVTDSLLAGKGPGFFVFTK